MLKFAEGSRPVYKTRYSAGADVSVAETVVVQPGAVAYVSTGVSLDPAYRHLGEFYEIQVRLRSSIPQKFNLLLPNGIGTIDFDYPDEIKVIVYNFGPSAVELPKGTRIAQLVLSPIAQINCLSRGGNRTGGIGSTGT